MQADPMVLIFLDIDGVMNTTTSCLRHRSGEVFVAEACVALRWLLHRSGAQVVVTSTRRRAGLDAMHRLFVRNGLADLAGIIIGLTPLIADHDSDDLREEEISQYLETRAARPKVLILDDKRFSGPLTRDWIGTDPELGLTLALARQATAHLAQ